MRPHWSQSTTFNWKSVRVYKKKKKKRTRTVAVEKFSPEENRRAKRRFLWASKTWACRFAREGSPKERLRWPSPYTRCVRCKENFCCTISFGAEWGRRCCPWCISTTWTKRRNPRSESRRSTYRWALSPRKRSVEVYPCRICIWSRRPSSEGPWRHPRISPFPLFPNFPSILLFERRRFGLNNFPWNLPTEKSKIVKWKPRFFKKKGSYLCAAKKA